MPLRAPSPFRSPPSGARTSGILVALDGSSFGESALWHGRLLARALEIPVRLATVLDSGRSGGTSRTSAECRIQLRELESYLDGIQRRLREEGLEVECEVREGAPAEEVLRSAREEGSVLVAVAARPRREGWRIESRGVAYRVMAAGDVSLLVARGGRRESRGIDGPSGYRRVAVAVDGSKASHRALRLAARLVRPGDADILLVHVSPLASPRRTARGALGWRVPSASRKVVGSDGADRYLARLERALVRSGVGVRSIHRKAADVAAAVEDAASDAGAELLVMGAHGTGGAPGRYGRCSRRLLIHGELPVLVVQDRAPRGGRASAPRGRGDSRRSPRSRSSTRRPRREKFAWTSRPPE